MSRQEVRVPDLGDFSNVEVVDVQVAAGDTVRPETPLITLETDKAAMEVPAPAAGRVAELKVKRGDRVSQGDLILILEVEGAATAAPAVPAAAKQPALAPKTASATAPPAASRRLTVPVPDLGDFKSVEVIAVGVKAGDTVAVESPLITLESDKASMDVPSPAAGRVLRVAVQVGQKVSAGDLILEMEAAAAPTPAGPAPDATMPARSIAPAPAATVPAPRAERPPAALPAIDESTFGRAHASPAVRKFARELGVNLGQVTGRGPKGRVLREDVTAFVKAILTGQAAAPGGGLPKVPVVDFAKYGEIELRPLSRVRRISGPRLQASWLNIPHVTQHDEADITLIEERRQKLKRKAEKEGVKLTPLAFIVRAVVRALEEFPDFNSSLSEDGAALVHKKYYHIGFAADTPQGLVVPVIRDAGRKDLFTIAKELVDLSAKARDGKITAEEMRGGTFTVSSLGGIGGTFFTPIINAPEVAILGVGRSAFRPVWMDKAFVPRLILPLSLSYDHRVIDGATGVRFTTFLIQALADVDQLSG